jgi:hypothetical protein
MGSISNAPAIGGYPTWFQDKSGLALEFCDPKNQAELTGGWCTLIPPTPATAPETFPTNFFVEHFGDQVTFGRIRVDISPAPYAGTYTVYHPFGTWIFPLAPQNTKNSPITTNA